MHASQNRRFLATTVPAWLLISLLGAGCGGNEREEAFREASSGLEEAQQVLARARSVVEERRAQVREAEGELAQAMEELSEAQAEVVAARDRVGLHATDAVLFRTVQGELLSDAELAQVAIAARVEKGVVTLSGSVPSGVLRKHAGKLAGAVPGVVAVENRIEVSVSAPAEE